MGPLAGIRIVELGGIGPGPFASMLFSEMGADGLACCPSPIGERRTSKVSTSSYQLLSLRPPLRGAGPQESGAPWQAVKRLVAGADALIEGFRPGVMERLGLGPDVLPGAQPAAGLRPHDRLGPGRARWPTPPATTSTTSRSPAPCTPSAEGEPPVPPLNLVGDFGGGGMFLAFGVVCALLEAQRLGPGPGGRRGDDRRRRLADDRDLRPASRRACGPTSAASNLLDSGAPCYDVYETADGKCVSVGSHRAAVLRGAAGAQLGLDRRPAGRSTTASGWPALRSASPRCSSPKTRDEWCAAMEGTDVCFAPVLTMTKRPAPAQRARGTFVDLDGVMQPAPAPRFSRTRPDPAARRPPAASTPRRCSPTGASDRRDRRAARRRRHRLRTDRPGKGPRVLLQVLSTRSRTRSPPLSLNRPERLNALRHAPDDCSGRPGPAARPRVRVIVMTGAGNGSARAAT